MLVVGYSFSLILYFKNAEITIFQKGQRKIPLVYSGICIFEKK